MKKQLNFDVDEDTLLFALIIILIAWTMTLGIAYLRGRISAWQKVLEWECDFWMKEAQAKKLKTDEW